MANSHFPNAGGSGSPGGSANSVQYNDNGAFGGFGSWDGETLTPGGNLSAVKGTFTVTQTAVGSNQNSVVISSTVNSEDDNESDTRTLRIFAPIVDDFDHHYVFGSFTTVEQQGAGDVIFLIGHESDVGYTGDQIIQNQAAFYAYLYNRGGGTVDNGYHYYANGDADASVYNNLFQFWGGDLSGMLATNAYYYWADSQGVFAIKEEFTQAVPRLYNPRFTKYTPGAANYERWITRYGITGTYGTDDTLYMGSEAGGTGTLRPLNLLGAGVHLESVPGTATYLGMAEMSAPSAPASNGVRIYAVDNGAGKTQLMALFSSGAAQQIAIQP